MWRAKLNKLSQLIAEAGTSIHELADLLDKDVLEISMAQHGIGYTHISTILGIAEAIECDVADIYPQLSNHAEIFEDDTLPFEDRRNHLLSEEYKNAFMSAGIDPDPEKWYLIIRLKSGNERRFRISSVDLADLRTEMESRENNGDYFIFTADCRNIILRKNTISEIKIRNHASCAPFSSLEDGDSITIISSLFPRPEAIFMLPDEPNTDGGECPLAELIESAGNNETLPNFIKTEDDEGDHYINLSNVELIEIPVGLVNPFLYLDEVHQVLEGEDVPLEYMTPAGSA